MFLETIVGLADTMLGIRRSCPAEAARLVSRYNPLFQSSRRLPKRVASCSKLRDSVNGVLAGWSSPLALSGGFWVSAHLLRFQNAWNHPPKRWQWVRHRCQMKRQLRWCPKRRARPGMQGRRIVGTMTRLYPGGNRGVDRKASHSLAVPIPG